MLKFLAGLVPATQAQLNQLREDIMSKLDTVLHHVAEKLDAAADRITGELTRLEKELQRGRPSPEAVKRVKDSVDRLHQIVPEVEEEDHVGEHAEEGDEEEAEEAEEGEEGEEGEHEEAEHA